MDRGATNRILLTFALAAAYFVAGRFGLSLAHVNPSASAVWPPSGIALAAVLLFGDAASAGIFLGAFLVNLTTSGALTASVGIALGNTLECVVGAYLVRRYAGGVAAFYRVVDFLIFVALAAGIATALCATAGTTLLVVSGLAEWRSYGPIWLTWWLGDAAGILLVSPALILWGTRQRAARRSLAGRVESTLLWLSVVGVGALLFSPASPAALEHRPIAFFYVPLVTWAGLRFGPREAASATLLLCAIALWGTIQGYGAFAKSTSDLPLLPAFMSVIGVMGSVLAASVTEGAEAVRRRDDAARAEVAVAEHSRARISNILESITDGFFAFDREWRITYVNRRGGEILGRAPAETVGKIAWSLFPEAAGGDIHEKLDRVMRDGATAHFERYLEPLDLWGNFHAYPTDEGMALYVEDVGERRSTEEALRHERELLEKIIDKIPVMITMYDPETKVVRLNQEFVRLSGWTVEDAAGSSLMECCYPDRLYREHVRRFMDDGEGWMDLHMRTRDGREVETSWANIRLSDDTRVGIGIDITERKGTERALQQADRRKDEFLATLSHELRSPLSAVLLWLHMLRNGSPDATKTANALEVIERNTKLQIRLIEDLLDLSRIAAGKLTVDLTDLDLGLIVQSAVESARAPAQTKRLELACEVARRPLHVVGDAARLQQVVGNLLSNAIKFTPPGGRIEVSAREDGADAVLVVRDSGEGIEADLVERIFDRFEQADSSMTRRHQGLGLGLAIARHLVEYHGGELSAYSEGRGKGATFTARLPIARLDVFPMPASAPHVEASSGLRGARVLVVDDDVDGLEASSKILSSAGAKVLTASSVREAAELLRDPELPSIVLTDLAMPDRDGFELLKIVRELEATKGARVPMIAFTALASFDDRVRVRAAGFDRHLAKPVSPSELIEAVRGTLHT